VIEVHSCPYCGGIVYIYYGFQEAICQRCSRKWKAEDINQLVREAVSKAPEHCYPPHIKQLLEARGYFNLSREERIARNEACLNAIFRSSKGDARAEAAALKAIRGHGDDND